MPACLPLAAGAKPYLMSSTRSLAYAFISIHDAPGIKGMRYGVHLHPSQHARLG